MKLRYASKSIGAYALPMVIGFVALGALTLGGIATWTSTNSRLVERNNRYNRSVAAAEAATEKIVAAMAWDFQQYGEGAVSNSLSTYRSKTPKKDGFSQWENFKFSNGNQEEDVTYVDCVTTAAMTNLQSQYKGLYALASTYRIISNAEDTEGTGGIVGAVGQEVQLATIPIFQFAIFSSMDLEINPGPAMVVNGRVHANDNIYMEPVNKLTFQSDVTSGGEIIHSHKPGDPSVRTPSKDINYEGAHDSGVNSLTLPIGTNNSPQHVRQILDIPPASEAHSSAMGQQRYYNKADMVILVTDSGITAHGSVANGKQPVLTYNDIKSFVKTNRSFYNAREGKTVKSIDIDVGKLKEFAENSGPLQDSLGSGKVLNSIYVADLRSHSSSSQSGVRVYNGQTLPKQGLTVATPNPLYVQGHYNAPGSALGTSDTSDTKPASLVGDAITILSQSWNDNNSTKALSQRVASATTVNAAILAGNVPTGNGYYSGGIENFPRFLENWSGKKFTYNGSMVLMFNSQIATAPWGPRNPNYYEAPTRNWAFDVNFLDPKKLPPGTPSVRTIIRAGWGVLPPNTIQAVTSGKGGGES